MTRLLDFADRERVIAWRPVNDVVMGGRSGSTFLPTGNGTAVFSGRVSLENGGGFASVRSDLQQPIPATAAGVRLSCRGDGKLYKLSLRTDRSHDGFSWQVRFTTVAEAWTQHSFRWEDFRPSWHGQPRPDAGSLTPDRVVRIGLLIADRQEGPFSLELAWIDLL